MSSQNIAIELTSLKDGTCTRLIVHKSKMVKDILNKQIIWAAVNFEPIDVETKVGDIRETIVSFVYLLYGENEYSKSPYFYKKNLRIVPEIKGTETDIPIIRIEEKPVNNPPKDDSLETLIQMGFEKFEAELALKKYPLDIQKAVNHILTKQREVKAIIKKPVNRLSNLFNILQDIESKDFVRGQILRRTIRKQIIDIGQNPDNFLEEIQEIEQGIFIDENFSLSSWDYSMIQSITDLGYSSSLVFQTYFTNSRDPEKTLEALKKLR